MIGERYGLISAAHHKMRLTVEYLLADRGLMLKSRARQHGALP